MAARTLPYLLFAAVNMLTNLLSIDQAWGIIIAYTITGGALLFYRNSYSELQLTRLPVRNWIMGIITGIIGILIWIMPYHLWPSLHKTDNVFGLLGGTRIAFSPEHFGSHAEAATFYILRFIGYIAVTPVFEELFVRSFLMRYLIHPRFRDVPIGQYTHFSFWCTALFFSLTHPEWIVAFAYAVLLNYVLCSKKLFSVCVIAHGTSNMLLIIYVIYTGRWGLW